jgi:SNF2 family DNA or RNA helicase
MQQYKQKPRKHQLDCLNQFGKSKSFALFAEMGTGKTYIIINNIAQLWAEGEINAVLVLAPSGVHTNWSNLELPKHMPDWVRHKVGVWRADANKIEQKELDAFFALKDSSELRILLVNWEALQSERSSDAIKKFCVGSSKLMIVGDESTAIKNPKAERTKMLMKLKKYSAYRRIMNGTPVTNSPFDLFSQFSFLDDCILGTTSYYAFKAEYAEMLQEGHGLLDAIKQRSGSRFTPQVVAKNKNGSPKYKNLDKLEALIAPHSFRVLKKDCLDLPDKIYKTIFYKMTAAQKKAYDLMKEENRMLLEDKAVPVANKLVALGKLAQIASGYYSSSLSKEPVRIEGGTPKLDIAIEAAQRVIDQGKKLIIWARHHIELSDIANALAKAKISFVQYDGRFSQKERERAKQEFQAGNADVFVGQQQSGGVGITLTAATCVIYFSNTFSLYDRLQSEDRAHRIGQDENVTYIDIVAENSIEHRTLEVLRSKKNIADIITGDGAIALI